MNEKIIRALAAVCMLLIASPVATAEVLYLTEIILLASNRGGGSDDQSQCVDDLPSRLPIGTNEVSMECRRNESWGWVESGLTLKFNYPLQISTDAPGTFIGDAFGGYLWNVGYWGGSAKLSLDAVGDTHDLTPECKEKKFGGTSGGGDSTVNRSLHYNAKCEFTDKWWRSTKGSFGFTVYTEFNRQVCKPTCHPVEEIAQLMRVYLEYHPAPPGTSLLSVSAAGTGTVTSSPAGIDCGSDCSEFYTNGTQVTLTATPNEGSDFSGWSGGGCSGTSSCTFEINGSRAVSALFDRSFELGVSVTGSGSGVVTSAPPGIDCGTDCSEAFAAGTEVTLTATPTTGSFFAGWSGACSGTTSCVVTMDAIRSVSAEFLRLYILDVSLTGDGSGTVSSKPDGIRCGEDCDEGFVAGTEVTLTPSADPGSVFTGWSGGNCSGLGNCTFIVTDDVSVSAAFSRAHLLSVSKTGEGDGVVSSTPDGLHCGDDCSGYFVIGSDVDLVATPAEGSAFSGWSGAGCSGTAGCTLTLDTDLAVTAEFSATSGDRFAVYPAILLLLSERQPGMPGPGDRCGDGMVYDCVMSCVEEQTALEWIGDGYCDDGEYGIDLMCPEFRNDDGDCQNSG